MRPFEFVGDNVVLAIAVDIADGDFDAALVRAAVGYRAELGELDTVLREDADFADAALARSDDDLVDAVARHVAGGEPHAAEEAGTRRRRTATRILPVSLFDDFDKRDALCCPCPDR